MVLGVVPCFLAEVVGGFKFSNCGSIFALLKYRVADVVGIFIG